jgi:acetyl esterase/lipase
MPAAKVIFRAIDILYYNAQNNRREHRDCEGITIEKDMCYNEKYPDMCTMDFYYVKKDAKEKYPAVLYIHGGGWEAGDKNYRSGISKWFAKRGFFVVNINYGLSPEVKYPLPLKQIVSAYNWVVKNADKLNIDLERLIVSGDSAGAYYSTMLAAIDRNPSLQQKLECKTSYPVSALVLDCGVYDLKQALVSKKLVLDMGNRLLRDFLATDRDNFDDYEYAYYVSPADYITPDFPPCFVTYAKKDLFCGGQGELLISKLARAGVYYEAYHSHDLINNHCFPLNNKSRATEENNRLLSDFLRRFAAKDKEPNWQLSPEQLDDREHRSVQKLDKKAARRFEKAERRGEKVARKLEKHEEEFARRDLEEKTSATE